MNPPVSACERLAKSREGLRHALQELGAPEDAAQAANSDRVGADWLFNLKSLPGVDLLLDIFSAWWSRQPLRIGLTLAADAAGVALKPVAQRHPVALVAASAAAGAVLVLLRPWRWISSSTLLAGVLPQLMAEVVKRMPAAKRRPSAPP
jgi:hypothetical protein